MSEQKGDRKIEKEEHQDERIEKTGQITLDESSRLGNIHLISIIGEIEGHENLSNNSKTTKYEHILPSLAAIEDSRDIQGGRAGHRGDDLIPQQAHRIAGAGRQPFHRRAHRGEYGLFLYCTYRYHGDPSGAHERHGDRSAPDL